MWLPPAHLGSFRLFLLVIGTFSMAVAALAAGDIHHFDLSPIASPQIRNVSATVTVTARDASGAVKTDFTGTVNFTAAGESGSVPCSPATSGSFVNGVWTGGVAIGAYSNSVALTASNAAISGTSNGFTVTRGSLDHFDWASIGGQQTSDKLFPVTVRALDSGDNLIDDFVGPVSLSMHSRGPRAPTGTGTNSSTSGLSGRTVGRTQCIYLSTEVGEAGRLTAAEFNMTAVPGVALQNFKLRLKHTALADYSSNSGWEKDNWTVVYQGTLSISTTGWIKIPFTTPFDYDGTSNLMVDISYRNPITNDPLLPVGTYQSTTVPTQRKILREESFSSPDPLLWTGNVDYYSYSPNLANIRFHSYTQRSMIRPGASGIFSSGIWNGSISIPFASDPVFLEADDANGHTGISNEFSVQTGVSPVRVGRIYAETFESGSLSNSWSITGTGSQRTQIQTGVAAVGSKSLLMDSANSYQSARNEATWTVNLEGLSRLMLKFWARGTGTSNGPPPKPFINGADFDGVAISADGMKWYEIQGLRPLSVNWSQYNVNLDEAVKGNGLTYNSQFKIRFNRFETSNFQNTGISIDDIEISSEPLTYALGVKTVAQVSESSSAVGTVSLPIVAIVDTVVTLESSAPAKLSVPAQITIPAGQSIGYFAVQPLNDALIDGNKAVSITAASPDFPPGVTTLIVVDDDSAEMNLSVPTTTITEGGPGVLVTVALGSAPAVPWVFNIAQTNALAVVAPANVTVFPGTTSATFLLKAVDDNKVNGTQSSTITVSVPGGPSRSVTINVADNDTTLRLDSAVYPAWNLIREGSGDLAFYAGLPGVRTTETTISFSSSAPSKIAPPAPVTILAGETSATVTFKALNDSVAGGEANIILTASAPGFNPVNYTLTFLDNDPHHFTITPIASPQVRGAPIPITVTAQDANGATLRGFTGPATLSAGAAAVSPTTLIEFINGVWTGSIRVNNFADDVILTVSDSLGRQGASNPFDLTMGTFSGYAWEPIAPEQRPASNIPVTVRAVDAGGNTITSVNEPITIKAVAAQPTVTIGTSDTTAEILSRSNPRARAEVLYLASQLGGARKLSGISLNVASGAGQVIKNWTVRMKSTSRTQLDATEGWDGDGWTIVHQSNWALKSIGWATFLFDVPFEYDGVSNLLVDFSFSNDAPIDFPILFRTSYNSPSTRVLNSYFELPQSPLSWSGRVPDASSVDRFPQTQFLELMPIPANIPSPTSVDAGLWSGVISVAGLANNVFFEAADSSGRRQMSNVFNVSGPKPPANVPFFDGFEGGSFSSAWTISSTAGGNPRIDSQNFPHTGTQHAIIDGAGVGSSSRAELTLSLNLAGCTGGNLSFWVKQFGGAEYGPPSSPFIGGADFDGVAISADGSAWYEVQGLRGMASGTWTKFVVDLDAAIAARGLAYTSNFKIRFNSYSYNQAPYDGFAIDDVTVNANPIGQLQLTAPSSVAENANPVSASVTFPAADTVDRTIGLTSSSPQILAVPSSVTVVAGQKSASFNLTPIDNTDLGGDIPVAVTATSAGAPSATAIVTVSNNDSGLLTLSVPPMLSEASGTVNATLTFSPPLAGTLTVAFVSSLPDFLRVPPPITVTPGQTSIAVPLTVLANSSLTGTKNVTITASIPGWTTASADTNIQDDENPTLTFAAGSLNEGSTANVRLTAGGFVEADTLITLSSGDPTRLTVPATITIPRGSSYVDVPMTAVDNAVREGTQQVAVTASAPGLVSSTATISIRDNDPHHFTFQPISSPQIRGVSFVVGISARDVNDAVVNNYAGAVSITAASDTGAVVFTPTAATFTSSMAGTWTGGVTVNGDANNVRFTVTDSAGSSGTSNPFDVSTGPPVRYSWSAIASPQTAGQPFAATITALDAAGNLTPAYSGYLTISPPSDERVIGSGTTGNNLFPLRIQSNDERTQVIYLASELGGKATLSSLSLYVTTPPGKTLDEWTIRLKHTGLSAFSSANWENGWTTVYSTNQTILQAGWITFPFSTPFAYDGVSNLMVDFSFNTSTSGDQGAVRTFTSGGASRVLYTTSNSLNGDPKSWTGLTPAGTVSSVIPQVKFNTGSTNGIASPSAVFLTNGQWTGDIFAGQAATGTFLTATDFTGGTGQSNLFSVQGILDSDSDGLPDSWEAANSLATGDGAGQNGAFGDPDGDKIPNVLEFAINSDPHDSTQDGVPFVAEGVDPSDGKTYLEFTYRRRIATPGISYTVETSADCVSWTSNASFYQQIGGSLATGDGVTESIKVRVLPAINTPGNTARFVRLRVGAL